MSVLRRRPVFEGTGEPGISSIPELREKLGIFPSPRAYMEETKKGQLGPSNRNFSKSQSLYGGDSPKSDTSHFANRLYSKEEEAWNFPKSQEYEEI